MAWEELHRSPGGVSECWLEYYLNISRWILVPMEICKCVLQASAFKNLKKRTKKKKKKRKMEVLNEKPVTSREAQITCTETKYKNISFIYFLLEVVTQYFHCCFLYAEVGLKTHNFNLVKFKLLSLSPL